MRLTLTLFLLDAFQKGRKRVVQSATKMIKKHLKKSKGNKQMEVVSQLNKPIDVVIMLHNICRFKLPRHPSIQTIISGTCGKQKTCII